MTIVTNIITDPAGNPVKDATVRITLITGTNAPGYTASGEVQGTYSLSTDATGTWSANLTPNSLITPANTYYQVVEGRAVSNINVPATGGPYLLGSILVVPPTTPGALGITGVQVAANGTIAGSRPEINLIAGTNVTLSGADNPGANRVDVTVNASGGVQIAGDLGGTTASPQVIGTHLATPLPINQGGTGSATQNFVDLTTGQSVTGVKAFTSPPTAPTPVGSTDLVNKAYADSIAAGLSVKPSVAAATTAPLPANTYNNGQNGLGATLTATATGVLTVDGYTVALGDRILVMDEATASHNGIYACSTAGAVGVAYVLTRATDNDTQQQFAGAFTFVEQGTVNTGAGFVVTGAGPPFNIGTTAIVWSQFSGAGEIAAGTGLSKTGNTLALSTPVSIANGGTGQTTATAALNALGGAAYSRQIHIRADGTPSTVTVPVGTWTPTYEALTAFYGWVNISDGAQNDSISFDFACGAGTYEIDLYHLPFQNRGIYSVQIDGVTVGTVDGYAASLSPARGSITGVALTAGTHVITLLMATKNVSSSGFLGMVERLLLTRTA